MMWRGAFAVVTLPLLWIGATLGGGAVTGHHSPPQGGITRTTMTWVTAVLLVVGIVYGYTTTTKRTRTFSNRSESTKMAHETTNSEDIDQKEIRIAHLGNSYQYFNDLPRFLAQFLCRKSRGTVTVHQNSCLRGGASLFSLLVDGNGMANKFGHHPDKSVGAASVAELLTSEEGWDFVILNDYSQGPARQDHGRKSIQALQNEYLPLLRQSKNVVVVLISTPAYKRPGMRDSQELGDYDSFTHLVQQGCQDYLLHLKEEEEEESSLSWRVAPVALVFQYMKRHHFSVWDKLYHVDDFHPSPHGTFLIASVLRFTLFPLALDEEEDEDSTTTQRSTDEQVQELWSTARYMQPRADMQEYGPRPLPTREEAHLMESVARKVCREYQQQQSRD